MERQQRIYLSRHVRGKGLREGLPALSPRLAEAEEQRALRWVAGAEFQSDYIGGRYLIAAARRLASRGWDLSRLSLVIATGDIRKLKRTGFAPGILTFYVWLGLQRKRLLQGSIRLHREMGSSGWWSTPHRHGPIFHEIGHHLHHLNVRAGRAHMSAWMGSLTPEQRLVASKVSRLAMTGGAEFVAETFAVLVAQGRLPRDVWRLYKSLGGPRPRERRR